MMKKKDLEMALEKIPPFNDPDPTLEQYSTPANIATDILFHAYKNGDVKDMKVIDLGCGTGIFSIGSWLLEAGMVVGYDISKSAIDQAISTALSFDAEIDFKVSDIKDVKDGADTIFMNPPFGCQNRNADRAFLDKAMEISDCIYSMHMADTLEFVKEYADKKGRRIVYNKTYKYDIPHTFEFHKKEKKSVDITVVNIR